MNRKASITVIALVILAVLSLSLSGAVFFLFQKEQARVHELEGQLEELESKYRIAQAGLENYKRKSSDLESRLKLTEENIKRLNSELEQEKSAKLDALGKLGEIKQDIEQQKELREGLQENLNQAQEKIKGMQGEINELSQQKQELESLKAGLEAKKSELESKVAILENKSASSVELGKIVVGTEVKAPLAKKAKKAKKEKIVKAKASPQPKKKKEQPAVQQSGLSGAVTVVDKEYNFAVINLGNKDGITVGQGFSVYHNGEYIGDIKVEKVHDAMSAANFLSPGIKDKIAEGDKVVPKA